ncbi:hypothetical protein TNCV_3506991 [Trichonephila clavipes]|uniref:Uncharacterized protein n=1 Tax=Trichonephila clavipes TaxID=2585209 RepID=A0A8X6RXB5_TRICX|nr:hypothetical protein TNCV_3506991 [Trichonephila clavipes]
MTFEGYFLRLDWSFGGITLRVKHPKGVCLNEKAGAPNPVFSVSGSGQFRFSRNPDPTGQVRSECGCPVQELLSNFPTAPAVDRWRSVSQTFTDVF